MNDTDRVRVDGELTIWGAFLREYPGIDKDHRRDIVFDLGIYGHHEPNQEQQAWAPFNRIEVAA